jgi:hypothetical protein
MAVGTAVGESADGAGQVRAALAMMLLRRPEHNFISGMEFANID